MIQDLVRHRLVERASITEPPEIQLQGLELHAMAIGYIFQVQGREVRLAGLRAKTGKLGDSNPYSVIPLGMRIVESLEATIGSDVSGRSRSCGHSAGSLAGETSFYRAFYFTLALSTQLSRPDLLLDYFRVLCA
jgi:hypothetical protein